MTALDLVLALNDVCGGFWSTERCNPPQKASKSEMRRWFQNKAVHINGKAVSADESIESVDSLVLFPRGARKCTLA